MFVFTYFCKLPGGLLPSVFAIKETRLGSVFTYGYFYMSGDRAWTCERTLFVFREDWSLGAMCFVGACVIFEFCSCYVWLPGRTCQLVSFGFFKFSGADGAGCCAACESNASQAHELHSFVLLVGGGCQLAGRKLEGDACNPTFEPRLADKMHTQGGCEGGGAVHFWLFIYWLVLRFAFH